MSAANLKKPPGSGSTGRMSPSTNPSSPGAPTRSSARASTPSTGVTRSNSVRTSVNGTPISARAAVKKPTVVAGAKAVKDEEARTSASALIEDLKARLQKAEETSEEYRKQVEVLQLRLDDALKEQGKLEERLHEEEERIEGLDNEKRESVRQRQDLERIYEAERAAVIKDKEASQAREEELQEIIQRLKDCLTERDTLRPGLGEDGRVSRTRKC
jgi:chromosome segregation ATPase